MKTKNALTVVAAVATVMFAHVSFAQSGMPAMRADVKADTASAAKSGMLPPTDPHQKPIEKTTKSVKTKSERKADTAAAVKSGDTVPPGNAEKSPGNSATN